LAKKKNPEAVALGKRGAKARMTKLTPEQRSGVAKKAAAARWARGAVTEAKPHAKREPTREPRQKRHM
jgi:hypothetical protein